MIKLLPTSPTVWTFSSPATSLPLTMVALPFCASTLTFCSLLALLAKLKSAPALATVLVTTMLPAAPWLMLVPAVKLAFVAVMLPAVWLIAPPAVRLAVVAETLPPFCAMS